MHNVRENSETKDDIRLNGDMRHLAFVAIILAVMGLLIHDVCGIMKNDHHNYSIISLMRAVEQACRSNLLIPMVVGILIGHLLFMKDEK